MKKKGLITLVVLVISFIAVFSTIRFYNIDDTKEYSSIQTFEDETNLKFHDLYIIDSFLSGELIKLSESSSLLIKYDKNAKENYIVISEKNKYPYSIEKKKEKIIPSDFEIKKIENTDISYKYFSVEKLYKFIVFNENIQYSFTVDESRNETKEDLFKKIKDFIISNKDLLSKH